MTPEQTEANVRLGVELITFFDSAWWGLPPNLAHPQWVVEFEKDPRRYFDTMLDRARDLDLRGIELAPAPGGWENALRAYGGVSGVAGALDERGLTLVSSYSPGRQLIGNAMDDPAARAVAEDHTRRHAAFLQALGADIIVTGNVLRSRFGNESPDDTATADDFAREVDAGLRGRFADEINRLGAIAGDYGVRIAIHTDAYSICSRNADIAALMEVTDAATVKLCPDAGHITLDGGDAVGVLRDNIDRVVTMHWKDCAEPLSGHLLRGDQKERHAVMLTYFRILGSGRVHWTEWMEVLREHRWRGWGMAEIDNSPDPVGELEQGLAYFSEKLSGIYR